MAPGFLLLDFKSMQDFRNLRVWRRAHEFSLSVYRQTEKFPGEERFGLVSQLRRAVVSIESNIAEGCGRDSDPDFARFLRMAMGSAFEAECQLLLARDLEFLTDTEHDDLASTIGEVKRMLKSLISKLTA